ncbi:beta-glucan synthesis-associated protein-domain-containing protein [Gymnopilus junonius]|uniref:Beta-glucan synthesis-associated protein-domain-containing protein n=1 Tax=Gymnopilus junonius TaxID=109634 RepID=A0A9P5NGA6_GYMJU|nr:beta-glucan synthesis-associated protein-domain-containing protein [Gymnopilus junonius]
MVLYRLADDRPASNSLRPSALSSRDPLLLPPKIPGGGKGNRASFASSSGESINSVAESKYPATVGTGTMSSVRGLIPYAYDPAVDENEPLDEEDLLHDPNPHAHLSSKYRGIVGSSEKPGRGGKGGGSGGFGWRGVFNIGMLILLVLGMMTLFVFYPVFSFYRERRFNAAVEGNIRINGTGIFQMPDPIDIETPESAKQRTGYDGQDYELVFSDEFNTPGRTFYPGASFRCIF